MRSSPDGPLLLLGVSSTALSALPHVPLFHGSNAQPPALTECAEGRLGEGMMYLERALSEVGNSAYPGLKGFKMFLARQPQVAYQLKN